MTAALTSIIEQPMWFFSTSPINGKQMIGQSAEVGKFETILAYIIASGELGKIIVKWQNSDTGKILSIKNFTHNPNSNEEYAWFKSGKGWQTGHYQVSVFTIDDQVTPW